MDDLASGTALIGPKVKKKYTRKEAFGMGA